MRKKPPRGTCDILPDEAARFRRVEDAARRVFERFGFGEIRTPIFEQKDLYERSTGATTDIVEKEMFVLDTGDRGDALALRPEGTPGVVRAYINGGFSRTAPMVKFGYMGPMFRYERPQAGRLRQFHQLGVETIGSASPYADAEVILVCTGVLDACGIADYKVMLNSLGCPACRPRFRDTVAAQLEARRSDLCEDCQRRLDRNVMRVLDCKNESCARVVAEVPTMLDFLCADCEAHFGAVRVALESAGAGYEVAPRIVRGLDYYTHTVFEVKHSALGAKDVVAGGGRYDLLVEALGGPPTPAVGYGMGIERALMILGDVGGKTPEMDLFVVSLGETALGEAFSFVQMARTSGLRAGGDFEGRSMKAQMRQANRSGARFVAIIGADELVRGVVRLKDMDGGEERLVPPSEAMETVRRS